jgi:hypothetical protein
MFAIPIISDVAVRASEVLLSVNTNYLASGFNQSVLTRPIPKPVFASVGFTRFILRLYNLFHAFAISRVYSAQPLLSLVWDLSLIKAKDFLPASGKPHFARDPVATPKAVHGAI